MNMMTTLEPPNALRLRDERRTRRFRRLIALVERDEIEATVSALIAELDLRDGDPDLEDLHDADLEFTGDEEDMAWLEVAGMGMPAPGKNEDDEPIGDERDVSWTEWHQRDRRAYRHPHEKVGSPVASEDDEDGDPASGIEDDPLGCDPEEDLGGEERGEVSAWPEKGDGAQPINMLGGIARDDEDDEPDGEHIRRPYRNAIRRNHCRPTRDLNRPYRLIERTGGWAA